MEAVSSNEMSANFYSTTRRQRQIQRPLFAHLTRLYPSNKADMDVETTEQITAPVDTLTQWPVISVTA
jgi:hypothetical protein